MWLNVLFIGNQTFCSYQYAKLNFAYNNFVVFFKCTNSEAHMRDIANIQVYFPVVLLLGKKS